MKDDNEDVITNHLPKKKLGIPSVKIWSSQTQSDLGDVFVDIETKHGQSTPKKKSSSRGLVSQTTHLQQAL